MKYKVIKEFNRFYLAESESGYKESFEKSKYKPDLEGYIFKENEDNYKGGIGLPPNKVNKSFNNGKYRSKHK